MCRWQITILEKLLLMNRLLWSITREFLFMLYANVSWASPCREEDALRKCLWCNATYLSVICLWPMSLRHHLILLIMRASDVSFVWSCSYSCESWPGNEESDSSVLRRKLSDSISFFCVHFLWNPERSWLSWLYSYPCEHYLASFVSGLRGHSCFAFWNGQWPQTRAGFLSSRLSVWCTAIRHQNASQCLVIHWRPPVSSSVDLLKNKV